MLTQNRMAALPRSLAGGLLIVALFYAPWDFGGTGYDAIRNLNWILAATVGCWIVHVLIRPRRHTFRVPRPPALWLLAITSILILILGWGMTLNAHSIYDTGFSIFLPITSPLPPAPGSVDYALSVAWMTRASLLLGAMWVVIGLIQDEKWLLRLWWAAALAGGSIALLGLLQKATGAEMIFWATLEPEEQPLSTFFATYYYHGNAGADLNLVWPLIVGLGYRYSTRRAHPAVRALWITLSVIVLVAVFSDTSRMGQFVALLLALALLAISAKGNFRQLRQVRWQTIIIFFLVLITSCWGVIQASRLGDALQRWSTLQSSWQEDARWRVDQVAWRALPRAGALGFGPGTFSVVFPSLQTPVDDSLTGDWLFLHDDYLQTLLEWGWPGGLLWAVVLFGGMIVGLYNVTPARIAFRLPRQRSLPTLTLIALAGVAVHGAVDFPLQISSIQLYVATYLGICWGSAKWPNVTLAPRDDRQS